MLKNGKEYYLMHKDIRVCLMEITEDGTIGNVRRNDLFHLIIESIPFIRLRVCILSSRSFQANVIT